MVVVGKSENPAKVAGVGNGVRLAVVTGANTEVDRRRSRSWYWW